MLSQPRLAEHCTDCHSMRELAAPPCTDTLPKQTQRMTEVRITITWVVLLGTSSCKAVTSLTKLPAPGKVREASSAPKAKCKPVRKPHATHRKAKPE